MLRRRMFGFSCLLLLACLSSPARAGDAPAPCDAGGADALLLRQARNSIDLACECDTFRRRRDYRLCVAEVTSPERMPWLPDRCRPQAVDYGNRSRCGSSAEVCCLTDGAGRVAHHLTRRRSCRDRRGMTSCISDWNTGTVGCSLDGCVPLQVCGDEIVEPGEECDPPGGDCTFECTRARCSGDAPASCGNGTLDDGEVCEPPGIGACLWNCQPAPCRAAEDGELDIACTASGGEISVASAAGGHLVTWTDLAGGHRQVLARRYDSAGAALDATAAAVSAPSSCDDDASHPAAASDGADYYVAWSSYDGLYRSVFGQRVAADGTLGPALQHESTATFGRCGQIAGGPLDCISAGGADFTVAWRLTAFCNSLIGVTVSGVRVDPAERTQQGIALPSYFDMAGPASLARLGDEGLWAWHSTRTATSNQPEIIGAWVDGAGTVTRWTITGTPATHTEAPPGLASGAGSALLVWRQESAGAAGLDGELRAVRITRADGRIDPDGGILLATAEYGVTAGPSVAFDGAAWIVAWAQATAGGTSDLYAMRVDATMNAGAPSRIAEDVAPGRLDSSSRGDGDVLVGYARIDGSYTAVRARMIRLQP